MSPLTGQFSNSQIHTAEHLCRRIRSRQEIGYKQFDFGHRNRWQ